MSTTLARTALIIGAGPAGLMAAQALAEAGFAVTITEAKPSPARKFLMAGKSGLNLTKAEPFEQFMRAFGGAEDWLRPMIAEFGPAEVSAWAASLGQEVFAGSTGRVFPVAMKGSPLLRAWLEHLDGLGVKLLRNWRWTGLHEGGARFATPECEQILTADRIVLALGGASWARLGSDGAWTETLRQAGVALAPFAPSNAGLSCLWSPHMTAHFGAALKNLRLSAGEISTRGEMVISARGLEGGGLYPLTPALREGAPLLLDLFPDLSTADLARRLAAKKGDSLANRLRKAGLDAARIALAQEWARPLPPEAESLAARLKALAMPHPVTLRPMDEAISTAGGIRREALTADLELRALPHVYAAGEMLDWEAPTGGYLLTASLATGLWAGRAAARAAG